MAEFSGQDQLPSHSEQCWLAWTWLTPKAGRPWGVLGLVFQAWSFEGSRALWCGFPRQEQVPPAPS